MLRRRSRWTELRYALNAAIRHIWGIQHGHYFQVTCNYSDDSVLLAYPCPALPRPAVIVMKGGEEG